MLYSDARQRVITGAQSSTRCVLLITGLAIAIAIAIANANAIAIALRISSKGTTPLL
ncbi:hypothetical protein [Streptomyces sp. LBL]|uniref:hypothetical protein n=1 Tax=Streptomyces sp. LBL TaxID=2940562 RepID=UPI002472FD1D|nr:hypothetical protein [Streptomyces sp. LBL]